LRSSFEEKTPAFELSAEVSDDGFFESVDVITMITLYYAGEYQVHIEDCMSF
jgi:hypothetical protein